MAYTQSPNMSLPIAGVGLEPGPNYAIDVNNSLTIIDGHDHSAGKGVQITPAGLNINAALSLQTNSLTNTGEVSFTAQSSTLSTSTLQTVYVAPGTETPPIQDLWYNDSNGTPIQLTANGLVNATIASIPGESYAGGTFFWKQGTGSTTPANFDIGSVTIRPNIAATTYGITISPPTGIASQYSLIMPALPSVPSFMTLDASGNETATIPVSGGLTGSNIAAGTITGSNIATATITGSNIASMTVTAANIASQTITSAQISNTAGITGAQLASQTVAITNLSPVNPSPTTGSAYSNSTSTYTTIASYSTSVSVNNRPTFIVFSGFSPSSSNLLVTPGAGAVFRILETTTSTVLSEFQLPGLASGAGNLYIAPGGFNYIGVTGLGTGTLNYVLQAAVVTGSGTISGTSMKMLVFQL